MAASVAFRACHPHKLYNEQKCCDGDNDDRNESARLPSTNTVHRASAAPPHRTRSRYTTAAINRSPPPPPSSLPPPLSPSLPPLPLPPSRSVAPRTKTSAPPPSSPLRSPPPPPPLPLPPFSPPTPAVAASEPDTRQITPPLILQTALTIIDRDGVDGLSMRRLSDAVGRDPRWFTGTCRTRPQCSTVSRDRPHTTRGRHRRPRLGRPAAHRRPQLPPVGLAHPNVVALLVTRQCHPARPAPARNSAAPGRRPHAARLRRVTGEDALHIYRCYSPSCTATS